MSLIEIMMIIIIHWVADFVLQTDEQAKGKSSSNKWLVKHTTTYSIIWILPILLTYGWNNDNVFTTNELVINAVLFTIATFVVHTIQDYFTSRLNSKLWVKGDVHNFFISVGFDQVLHYVQLFITYQLLFK